MDRLPASLVTQLPSPFRNFDWRLIDCGLSGMSVFVGCEQLEPHFVLKAWPRDVRRDHVESVHRFRRHVESRLLFVSKLVPGALYEADGQFWDISTWQPGLVPEALTASQSDAAAIAIGQFHSVAGASKSRTIDSIGVRVEAVNAMLKDSKLDCAPIDRLPAGSFESFFIHGDLHREHILFIGEAVSGLIDFSSVKRDHPAVDYARYFGDDVSSLEAYHNAGGSREVTPGLVRYLDRVIALGAMAYWQKRFDRGDIPASKLSAAIARFERIRKRLEW